MAGERRDGRGKWVAAGAGVAALLYLLTRRGESSLGSGGGGPTSAGEPLPPCRVRVDAAAVEVDGARVDVPGAVAWCRAAGAADVTATGTAIVGTIAEVVRALRAAGVVVRADPSVWDVVDVGAR